MTQQASGSTGRGLRRRPKSMPRAVNLAFVLFLILAGPARPENQSLRNWFNDPFFQIADGMPDCPVMNGRPPYRTLPGC